jgi:hemerythrin-like domain-containing protein
MKPAHPGGIRLLQAEHGALRAMLQSVHLMVRRGPLDAPEKFFDVLRAMLFYIDEFPERVHHRRESELVFPKVAAAQPQLRAVLDRLGRDHSRGEAQVRSLQHKLMAWEILGEPRRQAFEQAAQEYQAFYLEHMRVEEDLIFPAAQACLDEQDWRDADANFDGSGDPFTGSAQSSPFDRLFTRIVTHAPAPIGVGAA